MLTAVIAGYAVAGVLVAVPAPPADSCGRESFGTCAEGAEDVIEVGSGDGASAAAGQPARSAGPMRPVATVVTETTYVPTCSGNAPDGILDALCGAATTTCPMPGDLQMWVYTRRFDEVTGTPVTGWARDVTPPTVCIGPDDPVLDPTVALPALIEREFKRVVVLKGVAEVSPAPETLVNIPTLFTTSSPESYDIPLTLLGQSVVITAKAQRWTWHFGDGATASTTAAGTRGRVEHEYRATGSRGAYVVIEWSGTFSVNGGPSRPILGTATTTGDPAQVEVRQARSELVDSSS